MDLFKRAIDLLSETESSLQQLMADGLESQSYSAVGQIAAITERLAKLKSSVTQSTETLESIPTTTNDSKGDVEQAVSSPRFKQGASTDSRTKRRSYPRFERDGDKLVKIGWSDRDQRDYEHRAPREVVLEVCEALGKRSGRGRRFKMEEILADLNDSKEPVPSYQGYLTLAWLRVEGIIERDGKDGYRLRGGALSAERVETLWSSLSERSSK